MKDDRECFHSLMDDLGRESGIEFVHEQGTDEWVVPLEGGIVKLAVSYRAATGRVITSAVVAPFAPSIDPEARARALLEMNWQWKESRGFTISVNAGDSALLVADRRKASRFASAAALGAYFATAAGLVRELRLNLADFEAEARCMVEEEIFGSTDKEEN